MTPVFGKAFNTFLLICLAWLPCCSIQQVRINYESHYRQLHLLLFIFSWLRGPHAGLFFFDVLHDDFIIVTVQ